MHAYKFLSDRHAASLRAGNFLITRLRFFQLLELAYSNTAIGDVAEGRQITRVDVQANDPDRAQIFERLEDCGVLTSSGASSAVVRDCRVVSQIDGFVQCCSVGDLAALSSELTKGTNGLQPYNACVCFNDVEALTQEFANSARLQDGSSLGEVFEEIRFGVVSYDAADVDMKDGPAVRADPFRKRPAYSPQSEFRFFFKPREPIEKDRLFVACPQAAQWLESVPIETQPPGEPAPKHPPEFWVRELREVLDMWDATQVSEQALMFDLLQERQLDQMTARRVAVNLEFDKMHLQPLIRSYFELREHYGASSRIDSGIVSGLGTGLLQFHLRDYVPRPSS